MILKIIKNKQYEDTKAEEIIYKGNIKDIRCFYPLNNTVAVQSITIYYENGGEETITIGEYDEKEQLYKPLNKHVFLMNNEGKTIERI